MQVQKDIVQKLKSETQNNPAAAPVFHLLALRRRSRGTITLSALSQKMRKEGFEYSNAQYRDLLGAMSKVGLGNPVLNRVGNCVGIKNIKVNLADLGKAACNEKETSQLVRERRVSDKVVDIMIKNSTLDVSINGTEATLQFPNGLSARELMVLLEKLQGRNN